MELLLVILLTAVFVVFWGFQFIFLMLLEDDLLPGKYDKVIWAAVFIFLSPIAPFVFRFWKQATLSEKARKSSTSSIPTITTQDEKQSAAKVVKNDSSAPSGTAIGVCSVIGWICIFLSWSGMYAGGDWGDRDILDYIDYNFYRAMGMWLGASIFTISSLILGIIIRRHRAGITLIVASVFTMIATFFIV